MARKNLSRSAQGSGTIRKRSNGRWEARYTVGRDPATGKQIQKSIYGATQNEVRKKLQQVCSEIDNGIYIEPCKMTVAEWLNIWQEEYNINVKELTSASYETHIRVNIIPYIGNIKLTSLTAPLIQKMYNALLNGDESTNKRPLSPKTIKNLHGVLHKALKTAVKVGYIRYNPTEAVILPRVEKPQITPLTDKEISEFLIAIKGSPYEKLFITTLFTGMREGEIVGLTWDCIDFDSGAITIEKQLMKEKKKGGIYKFAPLKNDKIRTVIPAPFVMKLLYSLRQNDLSLKVDNPQYNIDNFVFINELGEHLKHQTVLKNFKMVANSIGIEQSRFHDLRHTFAVVSLQNGDSIKTLQENLGHATASFTMATYAHVSEKMKKDSADKMEKYFENINS